MVYVHVLLYMRILCITCTCMYMYIVYSSIMYMYLYVCTCTCIYGVGAKFMLLKKSCRVFIVCKKQLKLNHPLYLFLLSFKLQDTYVVSPSIPQMNTDDFQQQAETMFKVRTHTNTHIHTHTHTPTHTHKPTHTLCNILFPLNFEVIYMCM